MKWFYDGNYVYVVKNKQVLINNKYEYYKYPDTFWSEIENYVFGGYDKYSWSNTIEGPMDNETLYYK